MKIIFSLHTVEPNFRSVTTYHVAHLSKTNVNPSTKPPTRKEITHEGIFPVKVKMPFIICEGKS